MVLRALLRKLPLQDLWILQGLVIMVAAIIMATPKRFWPRQCSTMAVALLSTKGRGVLVLRTPWGGLGLGFRGLKSLGTLARKVLFPCCPPGPFSYCLLLVEVLYAQKRASSFLRRLPSGMCHVHVCCSMCRGNKVTMHLTSHTFLL